MYQINFTKEAQKQLKKIIKNKAQLQRFRQIIESITQDPYSKSFKFEPLKYDFRGFYSKRLTKGDRIVYTVQENVVTVTVISVLGHYEDK